MEHGDRVHRSNLPSWKGTITGTRTRNGKNKYLVDWDNGSPEVWWDEDELTPVQEGGPHNVVNGDVAGPLVQARDIVGGVFFPPSDPKK